MSRLPVALVFVFIGAFLGLAQRAFAETQPQLSIVHEHWKSSTGACTVDVEHARVVDVPAGVKARINGVLAALLADQSPSAAVRPRKREVDCQKAGARSESFARTAGVRYSSYESADWTTGLAHGRWLSVRVHVSGFASGEVHPWNGFAAVTFDLAHGGFPVSTSGFYTKAQRERINHILAKAEIDHLQADDAGAPLDAARSEYVRTDVERSSFDASDFLLTGAGVEVTGITTTDAEGNQIIKVPYAALRGIGTPGGPLDAATR